MGWGHCGTDDKGREIGYCIDAECDEPGCHAEIDRGLAYVCGRMHGGDDGCGGYFCYKHLYMGRGAQKCRRCWDAAPPAEWEADIDRIMGMVSDLPTDGGED